MFPDNLKDWFFFILVTLLIFIALKSFLGLRFRWEKRASMKRIYEKLNCQEFYDLMQNYRIAPPEDQMRVGMHYANVQRYIEDIIAEEIE